MHRRKFLATTGTATVTGLAGCGGLFQTRSALAPPLVENRPDAVYLPTHTEGMAMVGMQRSSGYNCALTYTYPHRFWLVTGTRTQQVNIKGTDDVHLMPVVWDEETGLVPPDINPQLTIDHDGATIAAPAPWPMLSQPMGFHFGDNVVLDGDGTYNVRITVGSPSIRRTSDMDPNRSGTSFEFRFEFSQQNLDDIAYTDIPADEQGTRGAVDPMAMEMLPATSVPQPADLPGSVVGTETTGDATVIISTIDDAIPYGGTSDETYLAVSLHTPYNRYVLPMASVAATITRNGSAIAEPLLTAALDPDLRYHYGTSLQALQPGDSIEIRFQTPPQTARHEGYETAFITMPSVTVTI